MTNSYLHSKAVSGIIFDRFGHDVLMQSYAGKKKFVRPSTQLRKIPNRDRIGPCDWRSWPWPTIRRWIRRTVPRAAERSRARPGSGDQGRRRAASRPSSTAIRRRSRSNRWPFRRRRSRSCRASAPRWRAPRCLLRGVHSRRLNILSVSIISIIAARVNWIWKFTDLPLIGQAPFPVILDGPKERFSMALWLRSAII